ncbi:MAG: membrane protein insertase YidC [Bacteroidota bacterium]|nr:membrane protein insertase YidC [Bacteroidota bacterium]
MQQYDKNSLIGFILMGIILIVFNTFFFSTNSNENDIPEPINSEEIIKKELSENQLDTISRKKDNSLNILQKETSIEEKHYTLENEKLKLVFSNKGGRIISAILKDYTTYDGDELELFDADSSIFNLRFTTGQTINTKELIFEMYNQTKDEINMRLYIQTQEQYVEFSYKLNNEYLIDLDINLVKLNNIIPSAINYMNLNWGMKTPQTEKSKSNQDMYTGIYYQYQTDKEVDYLSLTKSDNETINSRLNWVAFKQQFFSSILISKNGFQKPTELTSKINENSRYIKDLNAKFDIPFLHKNNEQLNFQFYFGPNHYKTLKLYNAGYEEIIPLGWTLFRWVNKYIIINIFDFLSKYFTNYGVIILLLTLIIKLGLSPFTYKAYLSQAKMKVLKPEIEKITNKEKDKDPLKTQQATMNLYRKAGVNPMGGCLPMLLQFPILIAMFRFFPASIELRQKSFLWAEDLSSYDSILELGFEIPFYGDHVSLFTLLMTISTILYTKMNSQQMATGQMAAQMKWMMYLMPIMFLGFFNNYAAGLSYYYFLANMITFGQQIIMKRFFINEDAIFAELEANKKKPKKKSRFQKKLEELQRQQERKMKNRR